MDKQEVAQVLEEIALFLELTGANPFKVRAYEKGARAVLTHPGDLEEAVKSGALAGLQGIGKTLAGVIAELVLKGAANLHQDLKARIPAGVVELLQVPGLGPKKARQLFEQLQIASLGELEYAIQENRLVGLPGFGARTQERLKAGIERVRRYAGLFRLNDLMPAAAGLLAGIRQAGPVLRAELAGGLRRGLEVNPGVSLLLAAEAPAAAVFDELQRLPELAGLEVQGPSTARTSLPRGQEVLVSLAHPESFGAAWLALTGSDSHYRELQERAQNVGFNLAPGGLWDGTRLVAGREEEEIYRALGLSFIPPELREGLGEIETAAASQLPDLLKLEDLKGCFHVHSHYSDGVNSLAELIAAAQARGWEFLGLSDHSQSAYYAGGLKPPDLARQQEEVAGLRSHYPGVLMFWGIESDILADGSLDYPDDVLRDFDFVIASVHSQFQLSEKDMTTRLLKAMENHYCTMLGHPTGRLLLAREGYQVDLDPILEFAARRRVILELNTSPYRLDLDWRWLKRAKDLGVLISLNPDAHSLEGMDDLTYGVTAARKGWLSPKDVLNTYPAPEVARLLSRRRE